MEPSSTVCMSSSPPTSPVQESRKERRVPSVTPRKFRRFFAPRSHGSSNKIPRPALDDITTPLNNRNGTQSSPIRPVKSLSGQENSPTEFTRVLKRRKLNPAINVVTLDADSENTYADEKIELGGFMPLAETKDFNDERKLRTLFGDYSENESLLGSQKTSPGPIKQSAERGLAAQLLQMSICSSSRPIRQYHSYPINDWRTETAAFYSQPQDVHQTFSVDGGDRVIPFCTTGCNTNSLVAVADEEGQVRMLESTKDGKPEFAKVYLSFRVHANAIIDMAFSQDDALLATASGDQTARVVDMTTQRTLSILGNHTASLKQVRFQPGANSSNNVIATSSRDGNIQIWDLRCKGEKGPQLQFQTQSGLTIQGGRLPSWGRPISSIMDAHRSSYPTRLSRLDPGIDLPTRGETLGRVGDMSVTALSFLPPGQEHLLCSASEGDAAVKLWDLRSLHSRTNKSQTALSQTAKPQSHNRWRHFGVSSLNINESGSRIYTLCKDNTVYAYSVPHLILGSSPELSKPDSHRRLPPQETKEGLGPLYGFRHPQFKATSFYVKSALRKAKDGKSELLAVGSSDGCAILFPTDERYLPATAEATANPMHIKRPSLRRVTSSFKEETADNILISTNGTALIRGHDREVGSIAWSAEGNLVTVGDDFLVRTWREEDDNARTLRMNGETEGRRWQCGWANVEADYDEDDC